MSFKVFSAQDLPDFQAIKLNEIEQDIHKILNRNQAEIEKLTQLKKPSWQNLMQPIDQMNDNLNNYWSPIAHIHTVKESEALRVIYNKVMLMITEYHSKLSQNEALYQAMLNIAEADSFTGLDAAQRKLVENDLRDFKLSGIALPPAQKKALRDIVMQLTQWMTQFSENLLDATDHWHLHISEEAVLAGLPPQALEALRENAEKKKLSGFVLTLDYPCYSLVMRFLNNRSLREELYRAYTTRASDQAAENEKWDNGPLIENILNARYQIAQMIGYPNYAAYSLQTKMAKSTDDVLMFLNDLLKLSKPLAATEFNEIAALAKELDGLTTLQAWDIPYYSEKLQEKKFKYSQEDVRPYFPTDKVMSGLFAIVARLFGITIKKQKDVSVWHKDVEFFAIYDQNQVLCGGFYTDLYARPHKREGAWMDDCAMRNLKPNGQLQLPVAFLTCNFMPPLVNQPGLLTHDDVITLFHEFGHCLHHLLTQVNYPSLSGINGVPWDAVEFPSQFLENFCWEKESLALISGHYQTNEPLPDELYKKMLAAKHFLNGMHMVRQLELALFDFKLHLEYQPGVKNQTQKILDEIRRETLLIKIPAYNRFQNSFSHIFSGSYAAGYYSYKWAEVLSADAYSLFEEKGIFDADSGNAFKENILAVGGVYDPMLCFIKFRGRSPKIDALLKHSGISV